jgi:hypothetical protein
MLGSDPRSGFSEPVLYFRFRQTGIGAAFDPDWNTWDTPTRATCKHSVVRFWLGAFAIGPGCRFISRAFSRSHRRSRLRPNRVRNGLAAGGEWIGTFSSARDRQRLRGFIRVGATTRRIIRALVGLNTANQWRCSAASREPPPVVERRRPRHRRWRGIAELKVRIHCPPPASLLRTDFLSMAHGGSVPSSQAVEPFAHVSGTGRQPYPGARRQTVHRSSSLTCRSVSPLTSSRRRTRAPQPNAISITPSRSVRRGRSPSGAIATGTMAPLATPAFGNRCRHHLALQRFRILSTLGRARLLSVH